MIVDCFTFFNELDVLELRLTLLDEVVDRFVLCEAPFTFRGTPKPLLFDQHRARFARWHERIVHLVYDTPPDANPWTNEWNQRAFLGAALSGAAPDDLILIGDVDEIPEPANAALRPAPGGVLAHRHVRSVGYVNRIVAEPWIGTKAVAARDLGARTPSDIRALDPGTFAIVDGGWHVQALGGAAAMAAKLRAFSHAEMDVPYVTDARRLALQFAAEDEARWHPLDETFPALVHEPRWAPYVWERPLPVDPVTLHAHGCFASVPPDAAVVAALVWDGADAWDRAGTLRFGAGYGGTFASVDALANECPDAACVVVDGVERRNETELRALAARARSVVAYARNARSFGVLSAVIAGSSFGETRAGIAELEANVSGAGFTIERRDRLERSIYHPAVLERPEPIDVEIGPFRLRATTRAALIDFATDALVFTLRPFRPNTPI